MHEILLFYKIKCKKSCFLLPQESGFRMLWKPLIIKMCSCRRREVMCLLSWERDCVIGNRCQASCIQTLCLSSGLCLLPDTEQWPGKHECRTPQLLQIWAQSPVGRNTLKIIITVKSFCWEIIIPLFLVVVAAAAWRMINLTTFPFRMANRLLQRLVSVFL